MRQSYIALFLLMLVSSSRAYFDTLTCTSRNECVVPQNTKYCYNPNQSTRPRDDSVCSSSSYQNVMAVHISSSESSIGYYDRQTLKRLGDWSWNVIRSVYVCASGQLTDGTYQSWCSITSRNNDFGYTGCAVAIGQPYVVDGCYNPDSSPAAIQVANSVGGGSPSPPGSTSGSTTGGSGSSGGGGSGNGPQHITGLGNRKSSTPVVPTLLLFFAASAMMMI